MTNDNILFIHEMTNMYDCAYYYLSGIITGFAGTLVSQPFDTCKIHLQNGMPLNIMRRSFIGNINWAYLGMVPSVIGYGIEKSLVFGTYLTVCKTLNLDDKKISHSFFAGLIAGSTASISITPAEQIKINRQNEQKTNYSIRHLYKGFRYTLLRESIGFSIYFSVYNQLMKTNSEYETFNKKLMKAGFYGAISAFIAWIPIYPIDTYKTQIQSGNDLELFVSKLKQQNFYNKIRMLYRGYHFGMMRAVPFHATCFVMFEIMKHNKNNICDKFM